MPRYVTLQPFGDLPGGTVLDLNSAEVAAAVAAGAYLAPILTPPGSSANFLREDGVWTPAGGSAPPNQKSKYWLSPSCPSGSVSNNRGTPANRIRANYMGKAPVELLSIYARWEVGIAAAITLGEIGIATGPPVWEAGTSLTPRGVTVNTADWNALGKKRVLITVTGAPIPAGEDIWWLYYTQLGTSGLRVSTLDVENTIGRGGVLEFNGATITARLNLATTFALDIAGANSPWVAFETV